MSLGCFWINHSLHGTLLVDHSTFVCTHPFTSHHQRLSCHINFLAVLHYLSSIWKEYFTSSIALELHCFLDVSSSGSYLCFLWTFLNFAIEGRDYIFALLSSLLHSICLGGNLIWTRYCAKACNSEKKETQFLHPWILWTRRKIISKWAC